MRNLKDLKLRKKTEAKVQAWLDEWLKHFIDLADGQQGNVYRADFEKMDFFYYTNCNDSLSKDPYAKDKDTTMKIHSKKECVMLQLLLKTLKGEKLGAKIKCTHCGYEDRYIGSFSKGTYIYCTKCGFATINTFNYMWDNTIQDMIIDMVKKGLLEDDKDAIHTD